MRRLLLFLSLGVGFIMLVVLGGFLAALFYYVHTPLDSTNNSTQAFSVETGQSLATVANHLEQEGLLRWGPGFRFLGRYTKQTLQAGEFELSQVMSPAQILDVLAHGRPMLHRLHFAEGLTMYQVAQAVEASTLTTAERFLEACQDQEFLQNNGIKAASAEGYLSPETYFFPRVPNQDPYPILQALLDRFSKTVHDLPQAQNPQSLHHTLILASLVEKETAVPTERGLVAGVFANRLKLGMLLQCDPTIIYGLGQSFDGNLKKIHLTDAANPYNTYVHPGLPPGPICSPGKAALEAAARPEDHEFLYFVSRQDGTHYFSRSLSEHNNAVIKYQRGGRPMPKTP